MNPSTSPSTESRPAEKDAPQNSQPLKSRPAKKGTPENLLPLLSRRYFLKLAAAGTAALGITAAGASLIDLYAPWRDATQRLPALTPGSKETTMTAHLQQLVRYATLAASGHNTQPWKFALRDDTLQIHPDFTRRLPVVDPDDRALWISLGCALENLLLAARAWGYEPQVTYPDPAEYIEVRLSPGEPQPSALFDAIPLRQNTRSVYTGQLLPVAHFDALLALPLEPGVTLRFITHPEEMKTIEEYVIQGNRSQYADPLFVAELIGWLRFNKKEALATLDGLYSPCSGNPQVPRWLGRRFVAGTKPDQQAAADAAKLRSSAGAVLVASSADEKTAWVRTGQVYQRLALQMTALNIQSALLNQPIEAAELREPFQASLGLGAALPQLLVRYGYADPMPRALRRPLEQVLV